MGAALATGGGTSVSRLKGPGNGAGPQNQWGASPATTRERGGESADAAENRAQNTHSSRCLDQPKLVWHPAEKWGNYTRWPSAAGGRFGHGGPYGQRPATYPSDRDH